MKRQLTALLALTLLLGACAGKTGHGASLSEKQAFELYLNAVNARLDGDYQGWQDQLVEIAYLAPKTRAGLKAKAMLQSSDLMLMTWFGGLMAAIAIPNFQRYQARAAMSEVERLQEEQAAELEALDAVE